MAMHTHWFVPPASKVAARGLKARHGLAALTARSHHSSAAHASKTNWARLLSAKDLSRGDIEHAIACATRIGEESGAGPWRRPGAPVKNLKILDGKLLANLFFEPSTRTASSFASAMVRMGGNFINLNPSVSSAKKGETMSDTVNVMAEVNWNLCSALYQARAC